MQALKSYLNEHFFLVPVAFLTLALLGALIVPMAGARDMQEFVTCTSSDGQVLYDGPIVTGTIYSTYWEMRTKYGAVLQVSTTNATCVSTKLPKSKRIPEQRGHGIETDLSISVW